MEVEAKYQYVRIMMKRKEQLRKVARRMKREMRVRQFQQQQETNRVVFVLFMCCCLVQMCTPSREIWIRERNGRWWEHIVASTFTTRDWVTNFRMSRNTFLYLCNQLRNEIGKSDTEMRKAISVERRVAMTLWYLATNADFRTISHLFGVSKASVCLIRREVCAAIVRVLLQKYIRIPAGSKLASTIDGFLKRGFPVCGSY